MLFISYRVHLTVAWLMVATVVVLSLIVPPQLPTVTQSYDDKLVHGLAYGVIMAWFAVVTPRSGWLRLALAVFGLGVSIECCQALLPYRTASFADVIANSIGIALGMFAASRLPAGGAGSAPRGNAE